MLTDMILSFEILKQAYGNHSTAAKNIGITPCYYRAIRNGRVHIPKRTEDLIILKARQIYAKAETTHA